MNMDGSRRTYKIGETETAAYRKSLGMIVKKVCCGFYISTHNDAC